MKNFVKYTLVSAAVAAAFGVSAGTLTATTLQVSKQGAAAAASTATTNASFTHQVNAGYAINDLVTFTITAGAVASTHTWPATINYNTAGTGGATFVLTRLSGDDGSNVGSYRVTGVTAAANQTTIGASTGTAIPVVLKTSALTSNASISVASTLSNGVTAIDTTAPKTLATSVDQFGDLTVTTKFDSVIDVAQARTAFVSGTSDSMTFTAAVDDTLVAAVTPTSTVVKLKADLGELTAAVVSTAATSTKAYDSAAKELTLTYTGAVTTDTITITPPTGTAAKTLIAGEFALSGSVAYTGGSESIGANVDAGEWTLNGALVNVPYMPFSINTSRIITVTNTGTLDGDVSLTAVDSAGTMYDCGVIAVANKGAVTSLSQAVNDCMIANNVFHTVSLTFTVNAEDKDITIFAAYNANGTNRSVVPTSQYKKD